MSKLAKYDFAALPANPENICRYIAFMAPGKQFSTVVKYEASLASLNNFNNYAAPDLKHFSIQQCLNGLKRKRSEHPSRKRPITPKMLLEIHRVLKVVFAPHRTVLWTAYLFVFFFLVAQK